MASFKKLKKKSNPLGGAKPPTNHPDMTSAPETFIDFPKPPATPTPPVVVTGRATPTTTEIAAQVAQPKSVTVSNNRTGLRGGRGRKTGRTRTFATKSSEEFIAHIDQHCKATDIKKNVLLERMLALWEERYGAPGTYSLTPTVNAPKENARDSAEKP